MIADLIARVLEAPLVPRAQPTAAPAPLDAIIVLGSPLAHDGTPRPLLAERVAAAAALWHAGAGRWVIATGGVTTHRGRRAPLAEADAMALALRAAGVPASAVIVEAASQTTADNARLCARELAARDARTAWIVTQPFHARRATYLFRRAGVEARAWHIADSLEYRDRRTAVRWLVREYAAWAKLALLP